MIVLKKGSRGSEVAALQNQLLALGYDIGTKEADGDFGKGTQDAVIAFQRASGFTSGDIDGRVGDKTRTALNAAQKQGAEAATTAIYRAAFFASIRQQKLFSSLSQSQVDGMNALLDAFAAANSPIQHQAYMLATVYHECAQKMQPIEEYGKGAKYDYGKRLKMSRQPYNDTPEIFYGRGFVQLTWYENYDKAGRALGVDLLHNASQALRLDIASQILIKGMSEGWFTGKKLSDYIGGGKCDYVNARRIINGTDKAQTIAGYAGKFERALRAKA